MLVFGSMSIVNDVQIQTFLLQFLDIAGAYLGVVDLELFECRHVFDGRDAAHVGVVDKQVLEFQQVLQGLQRLHRGAAGVEGDEFVHL